MLIASVFAQESIPNIPQIPMFVQGTIYINNKLAPKGTLVDAKIDDEIKASFIIGEQGKFELPLSGDSKDSGKQITVYVNQALTNTTITWRSGDIIDNLTIYTTQKRSLNNVLWLVAIIFLLLLLFIIVYFLLRKKR